MQHLWWWFWWSILSYLSSKKEIICREKTLIRISIQSKTIPVHLFLLHAPSKSLKIFFCFWSTSFFYNKICLWISAFIWISHVLILLTYRILSCQRKEKKRKKKGYVDNVICASSPLIRLKINYLDFSKRLGYLTAPTRYFLKHLHIIEGNMSESVRSNSPPPVESDKVILNLDGSTFITTKRTLIEESGYFAARFSNRWPSSSAVNGGEVPLDMDPAVFIHVLRYLRHNVLPIFYDQTRGFDHGLYSLVLAQADYLLIERLSSWIREKRYLLAVRKERSARIILDDVKDIINGGSDLANTECQYQITWGKKQVYTCPRGIFVHDEPSRCGRQCNSARCDAPLYHDEDELRIVEFKTKTIYDSHVEAGGGSDTTLSSDQGDNGASTWWLKDIWWMKDTWWLKDGRSPKTQTRS